MNERPPLPSVSRLQSVSPTLVGALQSCMLRVAFSRSGAFGAYERQSLAALLGTAVHQVFERASSLPGNVDQRAVLESEWTASLAHARDRLELGDYLVAPPTPSRWPNFERAHMRAIRGGLAVSERVVSTESRVASDATGGQVEVERGVTGAQGRLRGRVDRMERDGHSLRIVDLKSGFDGSEEFPERYRNQLLLYAFMWHEETGEWPTECVVESPTGVRSSFVLESIEAEGAAAQAVSLLDEYNANAGKPAITMATPSADACQWCDYRVCCPSFFAAVSKEWPDFGRRFVLGAAVPDPAGAAHVVAVEVRAGNLHDDVSVVRLLLPADSQLSASPGTTVAIGGALRGAADGDLTVDWQTRVCLWPAP